MQIKDHHSESPTSSALNRRKLLTLGASAGATVALAGASRAFAQNAPLTPVQAVAPLPATATRPQAPFRVWTGTEFFNRNPDLYSHMTLDAGGFLDPRVARILGKLVLDDIDGTQTTNARGSYYWKDACDPKRRRRAGREATTTGPAIPPATSAGVAVRYWGGPLPERKPDNEKWMIEGLRAGKKLDPNCFIAAWVTEPNATMFEVGREGLIDLFIVSGFTHLTPDTTSNQIVSWDAAMKRCEAFKQAGLLHKTIFAFGQFDKDAQMNGEKLSKEWLGTRMRELKTRFPEMPGVAFDQTSTTRGDGTMELIRFCDQLSAELWPATPKA